MYRKHGAWLDCKAAEMIIFEIHGGPFAMYQGRFNLTYQIYAANGFVVLYTNPRGSTGYGEAFSQISRYPSVDHLDLMAGVDAALEKGYVDEKRLYVGGCSGGGVLSMDDRSYRVSLGGCPLSGRQLVEHDGYHRYSLLHAVLLPKDQTG